MHIECGTAVVGHWVVLVGEEARAAGQPRGRRAKRAATSGSGTQIAVRVIQHIKTEQRELRTQEVGSKVGNQLILAKNPAGIVLIDVVSAAQGADARRKRARQRGVSIAQEELMFSPRVYVRDSDSGRLSHLPLH